MADGERETDTDGREGRDLGALGGEEEAASVRWRKGSVRTFSKGEVQGEERTYMVRRSIVVMNISMKRPRAGLMPGASVVAKRIGPASERRVSARSAGRSARSRERRTDPA